MIVTRKSVRSFENADLKFLTCSDLQINVLSLVFILKLRYSKISLWVGLECFFCVFASFFVEFYSFFPGKKSLYFYCHCNLNVIKLEKFYLGKGHQKVRLKNY